MSFKKIVLYSKTCVKLPLKKDKTKVLMTKGSLMQYFWPALSDDLSYKPIFCLATVLHRFYCFN